VTDCTAVKCFQTWRRCKPPASCMVQLLREPPRHQRRHPKQKSRKQSDIPAKHEPAGLLGSCMESRWLDLQAHWARVGHITPGRYPIHRRRWREIKSALRLNCNLRARNRQDLPGDTDPPQAIPVICERQATGAADRCATPQAMPTYGSIPHRRTGPNGSPRVVCSPDKSR